MSDFRPPRPPSRRQLLRATLGLSAVAAACGRRTHGELVMPPQAGFPLGVAAGDAAPDGALLWTRYTGPAPLELRVWKGEPEASASVYAAQPTPGEYGLVSVDVRTLEPATAYSYRFFENDRGVLDHGSPVGRFRTAPAPDSLAPVRFGATCCTKRTFALDTLVRASERNDLDAFLQLGDTSYNDGARSVADFRDSWGRTLSLPAHRALRQAHGIIATWDDHEFTNNWSGETINPAQFAAGAQTFFEHMPARQDPAFPTRVWRRLRWGKTAELFILDCRGERRPSTRGRPDAEYISGAQLAWLKASLAESDAVFKVILNSVPIGQYAGVLFQSFVSDRWEGYPAQRENLLRFIEDQGVSGVLWLAGDFHLAAAGRVSTTGPGQKAVEILVGPGGNEANPSLSYPGPPQFDWATGINNYAVLDLDPGPRTVTVSYFDGDDRPLAEHRYSL